MSSDTNAGREDGRHPSFSWDPKLSAMPAFVRDHAGFTAAMDNPRYLKSAKWCPEWIFHNSMGPINTWCLEALLGRMALPKGSRVLDLGCGAAATSIFMAMEYHVEVWSVDLWIDPRANQKRIKQAGLADRIMPSRAEAHCLRFERGFFDAVVSIDAYHYFGTDVRYLSYLSQFVRQGGTIGVVMPANAIDPDGDEAVPLDEPLAAELDADWFTFRNADWWRRHWSHSRCVDEPLFEMVSGGRGDWKRWIDATAAAYGPHSQLELNAGMLAAPAGQSLGFCAGVVTRNARPGLSMGTEPFFELG
jgi:SAM-dependent methyltransferase